MKLFNFLKRKSVHTGNIPVTIVNNNTATGNDATSWAAIDLIASSFANLSGHFFDAKTKQAINEHNLYDLINYPNHDETKFQFFYSAIKDYFECGNVYWYKYDNQDGDIVALFRLNPNKVMVRRDTFNQKVFTHNGEEHYSNKILHIPSRYGYNGLVGKSIFSECNNVFKISAEIDSYVNNSFNNNVGNRLIIDISKQYPDASEEQLQQLRNKFQQNYTGIQNAGKPLIKSGKIEYSKIDTEFKDNRSNQLLENRQHQEKEISKLFGVPLHLLNGTEISNIESIYILFIENAIRPIATQFEQSINKLIPVDQRSRIYFEYSYNSLLKTSLPTRIDSYAKQLNNGILSINEIRRKENLPEVEAGDHIFLPANLMPLKEEIIAAYMSKAKLNQLEFEQLNTNNPNVKGNHLTQGDDKS